MLAVLGETPSALSVEVTLGDKEKAQAIHARLVAALRGEQQPGVIGRKPIFGAAPLDGVVIVAAEHANMGPWPYYRASFQMICVAANSVR